MGSSLPSSARVVSEMRNSGPPCPLEQMRAALNDVESDIALLADDRLVRVQAHADAHLGLLCGQAVARPAARRPRDRRADPIARTREREEERIALDVDLLAAGLLEDFA